MLTKTTKELHKVIEAILRAVGTPADSAKVVADLLAGAHLAGHDSHGIQHLPRYVKEAQAGDIVPDGRPEIISETGGTVLVRGNWGWGHFTADFATDLAIKKAKQNKIVLVGAVEVNHIGRLGHYVEKAASEGIVTLVFNGGFSEKFATAAPHGGRNAVLAPNPIAMGFPTEDGPPVVLDFATTRIAGGKVNLAKAKGLQVPPGCIIDKDGNPSTDPHDWYDGGGTLLPFGEHKGFGIMVALEILSRILAGSDNHADTEHGGIHLRHAGLSLVAIDSGAFSSSSEFATRTSELVHRIRAVPPARGFEEVMAPGDFEHRQRIRRLKEGIQIPESTWSEVLETAGSLGVEV